MFGMYFDYYGYDRTLMCVCDTVIKCKKLFFNSCETVEDYFEYISEYTIVKIEKNKWDFFTKPIDKSTNL